MPSDSRARPPRCSRGLQNRTRSDAFWNPASATSATRLCCPPCGPAVDRIRRALAGAESIVVFGNYDVDGITSTALLTRVLRALGGRVEPSFRCAWRRATGWAWTRCTGAWSSFAGLIITVDCGTGAAEAVREAAARGVDIVVTDHHEPGPEVAPAVAVVNPKLGRPVVLAPAGRGGGGL